MWCLKTPLNAGVIKIYFVSRNLMLHLSNIYRIFFLFNLSRNIIQRKRRWIARDLGLENVSIWLILFYSMNAKEVQIGFRNIPISLANQVLRKFKFSTFNFKRTQFNFIIFLSLFQTILPTRVLLCIV